MNTIDLIADDWKSVLDFYNDLLRAVGAPPGHGRSVDAVVDSFVWGDINRINPPLKIRIFSSNSLTKDIADEIALVSRAVEDSIEEFWRQKGEGLKITFEVNQRQSNI